MTGSDLDAVRRRRGELRESMVLLEVALAAPSGPDPAVWTLRVHGALETLSADFAEHLAVTEGPDGFHRHVLTGSPRLSRAVERLAGEHGTLQTQVARLLAAATGSADVELVRADGTALLGDLARHRQRGADLVYEAFATDLGGDG